MDSRTEIRNFITDNFLMGRELEEFTDEASLLDLGIVDSTGVLELVSFLEQQFGFTVEDDELVPENLDSINRLVEYIKRKNSSQKC